MMYRNNLGGVIDTCGLKIFFSILNLEAVAVPENEASILSHITDLLDRVDSDSINNDDASDPIFKVLIDKSIVSERERGKGQWVNRLGMCIDFCHKEKSPIRGYALLLNQYCNLACVYCLDGKSSYETFRRKAMDFGVIEKSIDYFVDTTSDGGVLTINLFGGEPLLSPKSVFHAIQYARGRVASAGTGIELKFTMQSNLTVMSDEIVDLLLNENVEVHVDIDGDGDLQDRIRPHKNKKLSSFARTEANVRRLCQAGVRVIGRVTLTSENADRMVEVGRLHRSLGIQKTSYALLRPNNSDAEIFDESLFPTYEQLAIGFGDLIRSELPDGDVLLKDYQGRVEDVENLSFACGASSGDIATVDYKGDIYNCPWFVGVPRLKIGNVLKVNRVQPARHLTVHKSMVFKEDTACGSCSYRPLCGGGCSVTRTLLNDKSQNADVAIERARSFQCAKTKTVVDHLVIRKFAQSLAPGTLGYAVTPAHHE